MPEVSNLNVNTVTFEQAKSYVLKFGPPEFRYKTLDQVAITNSGLRYLDQLLAKDWVHGDTRANIETYLKSDVIRKDLEKLI